MRSTLKTRSGARFGLAVLFAAPGSACHAPDAPANPVAAEPAAAPAPARRAAFARTRTRALDALAEYGRPGSRYEMRSVAFLATPPPSEVTETLYFTYLEHRPDGSSRTGRGVARCGDDGRQLVSFWRREDPPP